MRLTGSRAYARSAPAPTMPPGLVELMEGLAKDVLKHNPENMYEFCAAHMHKLIEIRDGPAPPMKQLSLEQKIAKAQEQLRQKNKNRKLQPDMKFSEHLKLDNEAAKQPIKEHIVDVSARQPVIHKEESITTNEVEIFHDSNVIIAANDTSTDEASHEVNEVIEAAQNKHEAEASISNATQKLETRESSENVIEDVNENIKNLISVDTNETPDVELIVKSENVTSVDEQNRSIVDIDIQSTEHVNKIPTQVDALEAQLNEPGHILSDTCDNVDGKTDNFISEGPDKAVIKDELNAVASTVLMASKTMTAFTMVSDTKPTEKVVKEPTIYKKEEKTDMLHEEIFLKNISNSIEADTKLNDVFNEQKVSIISQHKDTDIYYEQKDVDNIESKESIEGITDAEDEHTAEKNLGDLLPKSPNSYATVRELNINQIKPAHQTDSSQGENTSSTSRDILPYSTEGVELFPNQVITVETNEKLSKDDSFNKQDCSQDYDVQNNHVDHEPQPDKELIEIDDKLPDQGLAHSEELVVKDNGYIQDETPAAIKRESITGSDESAEYIAVSGMDLETAAITIQKVFRTFLFSKSRASTLDDTVNENSLDEDIEKKDESDYALTSANINKERRPMGISRMDTVLQTVNEEKSLSLSDDSSLSSAATTIQAHVRGFLVRNRLASNKTASSSSLVNSDGPSTSLDGDVNEPKKTILNIHIVPERGQFMSRDESLLTSIDLPLDNSPPSSNLHPLGYDKSERRKQLKREDAVQSISPPSNNSGKISEEVDSVKETLNASGDADLKQEHEIVSGNGHDRPHEADTESCDTTLTISSAAETVIDADTYNPREVFSSPEHNVESDNKNHEVVTSSDEMDVVTPSTISAKSATVDTEDDDKPKLVHSGEFHDVLVQTQVKRSEASVVREFKNVLVYFLVWDKT